MVSQKKLPPKQLKRLERFLRKLLDNVFTKNNQPKNKEVQKEKENGRINIQDGEGKSQYELKEQPVQLGAEQILEVKLSKGSGGGKF